MTDYRQPWAHEIPPRPARSRLELVVDGFVWMCCVLFALAVAFSYLAVAL